MIAYYLKDASDFMEVFDLSSPAKHLADIKLPDLGTIMTSHGKHDSDELFYKFGSFTDPGSAWRVDMNTMEQQKIGVTKLSDDSINTDDFTTDQVWYTSKDGTKVPIFMVRKKTTLPSVD